MTAAARWLLPFFCLLLSLGAEPPAPAGGERRAVKLAFDVGIAAKARGAPTVVNFVVALPQSWPGCQRVQRLRYSHAPARVFAAGGVKYGEWRLTAPARLEIDVECVLWPFRLAAPAAPGAAAPAPGPEWKAAEKRLESDDPAVRRLAATVPEGEPLAVARGLCQATLDALGYPGFVPEADGAAAALARGLGDCTDFTDLFVALCRARGIPARHVAGYLFKWKATPLHSWAEFWLPGVGWAPVDLLRCKLGRERFGEMAADRLAVSAIRNDPRLGDGMLYRWVVERGGGVTVRVTAMAD